MAQEAEKMGASKYSGQLSCIRVRQFCEQHERRAMGERRLPAPSLNVGGAGRRRRWDCQRGRGERCGCGGGAYSDSPSRRVGGGASAEIDKGAFRESVCVAPS